MTLRLSARAALACFALAGSAACAPASADWIGQSSFYGYESGKVRAEWTSFPPDAARRCALDAAARHAGARH